MELGYRWEVGAVYRINENTFLISSIGSYVANATKKEASPIK
jgi:hypothetical protein